MTKTFSSLAACMNAMLGLCSPAPAAATEAVGALDWIPMDPSRLQEIRGGMTLPGGMLLSFGIERLVYLNGELAAGMSLQVEDVANLTPEQALQLVRMNEGLVVQAGQGGVLDQATMPNTFIVQNTLDGQDIRIATTLDLSVDTLGDLMQLNASDALHQALINAVGSP